MPFSAPSQYALKATKSKLYRFEILASHSPSKYSSLMASTAIQTVRLMLVSSEPSLVRLLGTAAQSNGWHLQTSRSAWDAMERVHSADGLNLVILDVEPPEGRD